MLHLTHDAGYILPPTKHIQARVIARRSDSVFHWGVEDKHQSGSREEKLTGQPIGLLLLFLVEGTQHKQTRLVDIDASRRVTAEGDVMDSAIGV